MKKNVLVTGIGQSNYILQLYSHIVPKVHDLTFNILNLKDLGDEKVKESAKRIFNNRYQSRPNLKNISTILRAIFPVLFNGYFWKDQLICLIDNGSKFLNASLILTLRHINAYYYAKFIDENTNTDVIHLHFPKHIFALFTKYLKKDYELIVTYWGSDIYRIDKWMDHELQKSILKKASLITCPTPEMEFSILTRFGFNHKSSIRKVLFIQNSAFYETANDLIFKQDWVSEFKNNLNINPNHTIILFGNNAHWENNHGEFFNTLNNIPEEIAINYHVIFPLTYGDKSGSYIKELKDKSVGMVSHFTFITDFMDWKDLAKLKIISDIYIHCPTTDGLSAYLTEFLFTNNLALVGEWLPYNTLIDFGIEYISFKNFTDLERLLIQLNQLIIKNKDKVQNNHKIIADNFSEKRISSEWVKVFEELN